MNKIIQWGCNCLISLGYTLKNNIPGNVKNTPWSYVIRFETSQGYIYLKHTPEQLALEAAIIHILQDQFQARVPTLIAHNPELNCFLMKDAGRSLREMLKKNFNEALFFKAIDQFTSVQLATADHIEVFLNIGVPDWRLDKLPGLYWELLSQKELIADGLSEMELNKLHALFPEVLNVCQKLSDYSIRSSIVQPDFNDNNTLIDEISQTITMIDLGEIVISHPFFSLLNCLEQIKKHHGFTEDEKKYSRIKDACLRNHIKMYSKEYLLDAFIIAEKIWPIYKALSHYRLMLACGKEKMISFQPGRLSHFLKEFMEIFVNPAQIMR